MDTELDLIQIVKDLLQEHADYRNSASSPYRSQVLCDDRQQHYILIDCGWSENRYLHTTPIHIEIIDDSAMQTLRERIWIHCDDTDPGVAVELRDRGISPQQIVLGFRPPHLRKYTGFGVTELVKN